MDYYIRNFDSETGIVAVEYSSGEYISFPLPVNAAGYVPVGEELDSFIKGMQPSGAKKIAIENSHAIEKLVTPPPPKKQTIEDLRAKRNKLLSDTDWTQLPGSPLTDDEKADWADYRQQLRDLTENANLNLSYVEWPTPPNSYVIPEFSNSFVNN